MREALAMVGDNGLYLPMTRVVRLWSMEPGPTRITNCYCPIYCNPFVMSWSGTHLCRHRWTCSKCMSDGAKESCACSLLMSLCVVVLLSFNNFSPCLLSSSKSFPRHRWSSYSITLRSGSKPCLKRQQYLPSYFIKNSTVINRVLSDSTP